MRNKSTGTLSPTVIFLFRLFALVLAALLGAASLNACPAPHCPIQSLNPLTRSRLTMVSACVGGKSSNLSRPPSQV